MSDLKQSSAEQSGGSAGARGSATPRLNQEALEHGCMMPAEPHKHTPTLEEFESCLRVLRWMRDGDAGLHESWTIPLTHICGAVRACIEIAKSPNNDSGQTR